MSFFEFFYSSFLILSPMLLIGLFLAGLIHVLISPRAVLRWLRRDSLKSVSTSAAIGVPIPLCSCSVVPVVAEMRQKGASRSACMSFLITAPETGADSILVTNAFFGPIVAIFRPVISFITAVIGGIFCIGLIRDNSGESGEQKNCDDSSHHHHVHHRQLIPENDDCYIHFPLIKSLFMDSLRRLAARIERVRFYTWLKPDFYNTKVLESDALLSRKEDVDDQGLSFKKVVNHVFHYGFVEVADDILFSLLLGIGLGGLLFLAIPGDLMANDYARWLSYPIMVLVGIPLYVCASATTPMAAALVAKGVSPGAALIFLMTGPATNTGTIAIIARQFGARFTTVYVSSVIVTTVILGLIVDALILATGWTISVNLNGDHSLGFQAIEWASALALISLIVWRFRAGALRSGYQDVKDNIEPFLKPFKKTWLYLTSGRSMVRALASFTPMNISLYMIILALFLGSGFTVIPQGSVGYGRLFGKVHWRDLQPGLHYLGPRPFVVVDKWPIFEIKSIKTIADQEYVTGDLNLLSLSVNVQYRVKDPYTYHYGISNPEKIIEDSIRDHIRGFVASRGLDKLLNIHRANLEMDIRDMFENKETPHGELKYDPVLQSIELVKFALLGISPVIEAMPAFREVSSAQEDQERIIINAQEYMVSLIPQAHGNGYYETEQAEGTAFRKTATAAATARAISVVSSAVTDSPNVLHNMLWREKLETALSGNTKIIVPTTKSLDKLALWKKSSSMQEERKSNHHDGREGK